ncbi:MAG TPA: hypothetical protein VLL52_14010 [Anaerolineae bacterium]|nr:hypothetical protein [Anaerolineae bacterium]
MRSRLGRGHPTQTFLFSPTLTQKDTILNGYQTCPVTPHSSSINQLIPNQSSPPMSSKRPHKR